MAFDPSLVSLAEAKEFCRVDGTTQDGLLSRLVVAASEWIAGKTRDGLKERTYDGISTNPDPVLVDGTGMGCLYSPFWPVSSVTAVEYLSSTPDTWTAIDLVAHPVFIDERSSGRLFFRDQAFPYGKRNVRLTMVAGYADGAVPESLKTATLEMVLSLYKQKDKQLAGVASRSFEGQTVVYRDEDVPKQVWTLIEPYRAPVF